MQIDRRKFLILSGATLLAQHMLEAAPLAHAAQTAGGVPWHQKIKRVGQINFNERDPVELDVNAWADYWAELKADAVLVSVTGIIAFYPTNVPLHRRSSVLGDKDFFGECCTAAKSRGMRVIARMSPDLQWEEATRVKPQWFRKTQDGRFIEHTESPGLYSTCMFSTYFTEHIPAIMREVNSRYDIDGIFTNGWPDVGSPPVCYCELCRGTAAQGTPAFLDRHLARTVELWKLYDSIAKEKKPDNVYFANLGAGIRAQLNLKQLAEHIDWFNCDNQGRGGDPAPAWECAQQGRVARSVMKGKTITNVTGSWSTGSGIRWRNAAKSPAEATLWMAQSAASGMTNWYHWLGGQTGMGEDRRWQKAGREFFKWMSGHDEHFTYGMSVANLGVVWAQRPNWLYHPPGATNAGGGYSEFMQGLYYALLEGRFLFDFVHEDDLSAQTLSKYSALLLPNVALLSDEQADQIKAYVAAGGSLMTTFETGHYDQTGKRRDTLALGDLFAIAPAGDIQGPNGNSSYARIEQRHPILEGFEDTSILPYAEYRLPVSSYANKADPLTVIPAYTSYPPEMCYAPTPNTDEAAVIIFDRGSSRLIHFPGDIDRTNWRSCHTDVSRLLQNSVRWLLNGSSPISIEGEGLVETFAWETVPGYSLHIVNYNNPNLHKGWVRRHYPIGPQNVRMDVPAGAKIAAVELLRAGKTVEFRQNGARVEFTIPSVVDYEVAAVRKG